MNGQDKTMIPDLTADDLKRLANQKEYGTIQHYFRVLRGWKGWELAVFYSEALASLKDLIFEDEEIKFLTANWIHVMENRNEVPVNRTKRALLAGFLVFPWHILVSKHGSNQSSLQP